jgi:outer membrane protein assembly factor BamB
VNVDGTPLSYVAADTAYEGTLSIGAGATVTVTVKVNGATYTASQANFSGFPAIIAPSSGTFWYSAVTNEITWSGTVPDSTSQNAVAIVDSASGAVIWPPGQKYQLLSPGQNRTFVPGGSLPAGSDILLVGIIDPLGFQGAAPGSQLVISGFTASPLGVRNASYLTMAPTQITVGTGKSFQLAVIATDADGTHPDVSSQANWSSSDTSKVTVNSSGLITGVAPGASTVTAQYQGLSTSIPVNVFTPNPSPAPPLTQAVAYQIDYAHSGRVTLGPGGPTFPPTAHWSVTLSGTSISYPIIAAGKVFVTTSSTPVGGNQGSTLYALNEADGNNAWGPVSLPGTFSFSAATYDHGTLFVVTYDGLLRSFDAATGTPGWSVQLSVAPGFSTPTAVNGLVYVMADGVVAVDETNGKVIWSQNDAFSAAGTSPTISPDGVFAASACDALKIDPIGGNVIWHITSDCVGAGLETPVYANGALYARQLYSNSASQNEDQILDAASGTLLGTFLSDSSPVFSASTSFYVSRGTLSATSLSGGTTLWTFTGDGHLLSPPIVIDSAVVIESSSGTVYALDAASGLLLWSGSAGTTFSPGNYAAIGAGEGYLVVSAGNVLNGWRLIP